MAGDYASAIRGGTMAAGRLHRRLALRERIEGQGGGSIDVFAAMVALELPLLLRPLRNLLGAYLREPAHGVLVTTRRPLSIQRFTAAHELGHYYIGHEPSLDDEEILRRSPFAAEARQDLQEVEANAFAAAFLSHAEENYRKAAAIGEHLGKVTEGEDFRHYQSQYGNKKGACFPLKTKKTST